MKHCAGQVPSTHSEKLGGTSKRNHVSSGYFQYRINWSNTGTPEKVFDACDRNAKDETERCHVSKEAVRWWRNRSQLVHAFTHLRSTLDTFTCNPSGVSLLSATSSKARETRRASSKPTPPRRAPSIPFPVLPSFPSVVLWCLLFITVSPTNTCCANVIHCPSKCIDYWTEPRLPSKDPGT